jgi:hypothetical protein
VVVVVAAKVGVVVAVMKVGKIGAFFHVTPGRWLRALAKARVGLPLPPPPPLSWLAKHLGTIVFQLNLTDANFEAASPAARHSAPSRHPKRSA